jgi:hypothetical protein
MPLDVSSCRPLCALRLAAVVATAFGAVVVLGCMSISIGKFTGTTFTDDNGALCQSDEEVIRPGCEQDIYYPIPYASVPHLTLSNTPFDQVTLVEQREDRFRVRNTGAFSHKITWKAKGVRATTVVTVPPPLPPVAPVPPTPTATPPLPPVPPGP